MCRPFLHLVDNRLSLHVSDERAISTQSSLKSLAFALMLVYKFTFAMIQVAPEEVAYASCNVHCLEAISGIGKVNQFLYQSLQLLIA